MNQINIEKIKEHLLATIDDAQQYVYEETNKDYSKLPQNLQYVIDSLEEARRDISVNL